MPGYQVHVLDNLSTGNRSAVDSRASFKQLDVYDASALKTYLEENQIDAVLHCAGEIVVSESIENPSKILHCQCCWYEPSSQSLI